MKYFASSELSKTITTDEFNFENKADIIKDTEDPNNPLKNILSDFRVIESSSFCNCKDFLYNSDILFLLNYLICRKYNKEVKY